MALVWRSLSGDFAQWAWRYVARGDDWPSCCILK
jgi:hypothetical protein